jgi:hypothetical protein
MIYYHFGSTATLGPQVVCDPSQKEPTQCLHADEHSMVLTCALCHFSGRRKVVLSSVGIFADPTTGR